MNINDFCGDFKDEKPLDRIVTDGGFCGIFRTIGCVGDSLSSGEFELKNADGESLYYDFYEYSWGQYIARMTGSKVRNFSRGGMRADWYCTEFAEENGFWSPKVACQAYIIALGVNDFFTVEGMELGSVKDICAEDYTKNKPTFAGWYGQIVQRLKEIQPEAKFFFVTIPHSHLDSETRIKKSDGHARVLHELAEYFSNSYVLDIREYGPVHDAEFHRRYYMYGHLNPCGYMLTAKIISSYIDYIIRHNPEDFNEVAFIGTPYTRR